MLCKQCFSTASLFCLTLLLDELTKQESVTEQQLSRIIWIWTFKFVKSRNHSHKYIYPSEKVGQLCSSLVAHAIPE